MYDTSHMKIVTMKLTSIEHDSYIWANVSYISDVCFKNIHVFYMYCALFKSIVILKCEAKLCHSVNKLN